MSWSTPTISFEYEVRSFVEDDRLQLGAQALQARTVDGPHEGAVGRMPHSTRLANAFS